MDRLHEKIAAGIDALPPYEVYGTVTKVLGLLVEIAGFDTTLSVGAHVHLKPRADLTVPCEVIGFQNDRALLLPFGSLEGIGLGCKAVIQSNAPVVYPSEDWLGRVVNALGEPIDGKGPLKHGGNQIPLRNKPPPPHARQRIGAQLDLGVRAVNTFLATCKGQRMGIFAGSGVGKSVLLSMMARYTKADVAVIGLVGERGREVQEFLEDDLGMAQREIGLSGGEPPTSKGYPPTTFGELARLLERAGPGAPGTGNITGIFSVLVEGDDTNEPISDAVRGIIDGHIVMRREIADRGRYPAIDVLKSISRALPKALTDEQNAILRRAKQIISSYEDMEELIRLGAYRRGSDKAVDEAIRIYPQIEEFLSQHKDESTSIEESFALLDQIVNQ